MQKPMVVRDERTETIENASYRWGYRVLAFGILVAIGYRSFFLGESSWDLMALLLLSGLVTTLYQRSNDILTHHWARVALITALIAAAIAVAVVVLIAYLH